MFERKNVLIEPVMNTNISIIRQILMITSTSMLSLQQKCDSKSNAVLYNTCFGFVSLGIKSTEHINEVLSVH